MTRIAAVYDIHGNSAALEAVLEAAETEGFDGLLCGGDIAMLGPEPAACVDRLRSYGDRLVAIRGNTDRWVASDQPDEVLEWTRAALGPERTEWLGGLPATVVMEQQDMLVVHATPGSDETVIAPDSPEDEVVTELAGVVQHTVLYGHIHIQYRRQVGSIELVNPGSVGLPFDGDPRAAWAMVEDGAVAFRRTDYEVRATIAAVNAKALPRGDWIGEALRTARRT
jgi:putative phosphoesterase